MLIRFVYPPYAVNAQEQLEEPTENLCNVIFTLTDSYGDGWNGNYLLVEYNGVSEQIVFEGEGTSYKEKTITYKI